MPKQGKRTRKFEGKVYQLFDWAASKREAMDEASEMRGSGFFVRVTPAGDGYHIWRRSP